MPARIQPSAALPVAYITLRILIVLNWIIGVSIVVLLVAMPTRQWIISALDLTPSPQSDRMIFGLQAIGAIGIIATPINDIVLKRLLAMVRTVRAGDPFVAANAYRPQ